MKLYNQSNYLLIYDQNQDFKSLDHFPDPVELFQVSIEDLENGLAITLPTSLSSKGQHLYQKLKGTLQWNGKGEILTEDNPTINESHIGRL